MQKLLAVNGIIEMIAGVVLILRPDLLLFIEDQSSATLTVAKLYGVLAFTFGAICFIVAQIFEYSSVFKRIIMIIVAFHLMIGLQTYSAYQVGVISHLGAAGVHFSLAVIFVLVYMKSYDFFNKPN